MPEMTAHSLFSTLGGDGIDDGYYLIYDGPDISDPDNLIVKGSGNCTEEVKHFTVAGAESSKEQRCFQIDCEVSSWESWSPCSELCDGSRNHTRDVVTNPDCGGELCLSYTKKRIVT